MGLDSHICIDSQLPVERWDEHLRLHSLGRTFCSFMCQDGGDRTVELYQIGRLVGVDFTPLDEMQEYLDERWVADELEWAKSEVEEQQILQDAEASQARLKGNLDSVLATIEALLYTLPSVENLPARLVMADKRDVLHRDEYFADFLLDKGDGYIGNNFGQDLRNFKRFLEFAKSHGNTTVYFNFG